MTRFLADENITQLVVERLRLSGFDVESIRETNSGAADQVVLDIARNESRILITEDRDFGELVVRQQLGVVGVVLLELDRLSNAAEADLVATVVSTHLKKLSGNLLVIEPARVRLRPLRR